MIRDHLHDEAGWVLAGELKEDLQDQEIQSFDLAAKRVSLRNLLLHEESITRIQFHAGDAAQRYTAHKTAAVEAVAVARAVERNQSVKTSVRQLVDFIGESSDGIEADADLLSADIVSNSLSSHDAWVSNKILEAKQGREKVQEAMVTVATSFRAYSAALLCSDYQNLDLSDLHDTRRQTGDLLEHIADLDAWVAGLARDYEQSMAQVLLEPVFFLA